VEERVLICCLRTVATLQNDFLTNSNNKSRSITLITPYFEAANIRVMQATEDSDTLIATTAIRLIEKGECVTVFATDTDVLVL